MADSTENKNETQFSLFNALINVNMDKLGKPMEKLIDVCSKGTGIAYLPRHIKKLASASKRAGKQLNLTEQEIKELFGTSFLLTYGKQDRQRKNIQSITQKAIDALPDTVDDKPVDEDWVYQFYNSCQDIGNEEMQSLWAKILAGEVAKPKSFSYRTLNIVKMLHKDDANLFSEFCAYIIKVENDECVYGCIYAGNNKEEVYRNNMGGLALLHLSNLGLVNHSAGVGFSNKQKTYIYLDEEKYQVNVNNKQNRFSCDILTDVGVELFPISGAILNKKYKKYLLNLLKEHGLSLEKRDGGN